jgi:hypothetical protein
MIRDIAVLGPAMLLTILVFNVPAGTSAKTARAVGLHSLTGPRAVAGSWHESVLYAFHGGTDGLLPKAGLVADANGAVYGTVTQGGGHGEGQQCALTGCGAVFKLSPGLTSYTESVIYGFYGPVNSDGTDPLAGLIADTKGCALRHNRRRRRRLRLPTRRVRHRFQAYAFGIRLC